MEKIYLLEEHQDTTFNIEKAEEWKQMIEEMGLEGQKKLISKDEQTTPIPFMFMNTEMVRMFETLCPRKVSLKDYQASTIPLQVLGAIKLAETEKYFDDIGIWYADANPDPIAIGHCKSNGNNYLIARWGDELREFPELLVKAKDIWIKDAKITLEEKIQNAKENLNNLQGLCHKFFKGEWVYLG